MKLQIEPDHVTITLPPGRAPHILSTFDVQGRWVVNLTSEPLTDAVLGISGTVEELVPSVPNPPNPGLRVFTRAEPVEWR